MLSKQRRQRGAGGKLTTMRQRRAGSGKLTTMQRGHVSRVATQFSEPTENVSKDWHGSIQMTDDDDS